MNIIEYFYDRADVDGDDCWNWQLSCSQKGYGFFWHPKRKKLLLAHRFAYELVHGTIPEGKIICHHCDNPPCVNPTHLFIGTDYDNAHDKINKGRAPSHVGVGNPRAKLTPNKVELIKDLYATTGASQTFLAKLFSVSQQTISAVIQEVNWATKNDG